MPWFLNACEVKAAGETLARSIITLIYCQNFTTASTYCASARTYVNELLLRSGPSLHTSKGIGKI